MRLVMKFGGSSIADGKKLRAAGDIVARSIKEGNAIIVVVSALSNITDELVEICDTVSWNKRTLVSAVQSLLNKHMQEMESAIRDSKVRSETLKDLKELSKELENVLLNATRLKEITPRTRDYLLSFGERFSAPIFSGVLKDLGIKSRYFTGPEAGIVTDDHFGSAQPLMKMTTYDAKETLEPLLRENVTPVVTGFIGATPEGVLTTLGRGGSDYSATILACALEADEVWIWTDVDGLMTADPKIEPMAKTIAIISYAEAIEMAYFGAKGMQSRALEAAAEKGIPIHVKNTFEPDGLGTLIVQEQFVKGRDVVKAVALVRDVSSVTVSGAGMVGSPGVAASVFGLLGQNNVNILMISQSSSEASISFVIPKRQLVTTVNMLEMGLLGKGTVKEVISEDDVCIVAVVGAGMKGVPGVAARTFKAVADQGVNIRMIAQGSSELNISFVVRAEDGAKTVQTLHREFGLGI
jgi:aspartate kinase